MSSMKEIKQRVANVGTTRQVVKAMNMVAATRLNKARLRLEGIRPLFKEIRAISDNLINNEDCEGHILVTQPQKQKSAAYIIFTGNRGLCGGYNTIISEKTLAHMKEKDEKLIIVGSKGVEFFRRNKKQIKEKIIDVPENDIFESVGRIGEIVTELYLNGEVDEVFIAYTYFKTTLSYEPMIERLLPLGEYKEDDAVEDSMKYEPDASTFLENFIPMYLQTFIFSAAAESVASENAARMISMDSADKNAGEIIDELKLMFNRKRQAAITQELNEIIGGANIFN